MASCATDRRDRGGRVPSPKKALDERDSFWIEVALAFGGRSPEEWQEAITPEWREKLIEYRETYGPFNAPLRFERALAGLGAYFIKGKSQRDLMTWPKEPEQEPTPEGLFAIFKGLAAQKPEGKK